MHYMLKYFESLYSDIFYRNVLFITLYRYFFNNK